jgi:hypothetical protein
MKNLFKTALVMLAFGAMAQVSQAALIYSCPDASKCNGNEYAVFVASQSGNNYILQVDIKVTSNYTGNQFTDNVVALAIKLGGLTFSNGDINSVPGGNWTFSTNELNANGCDGGGTNSLCAEANSFADGANLVGADTILSWQFKFNSPASSIETVHLKYLYSSGTDSNGGFIKVGSLGSFDIHVQDGPDGDDPGVPEPSTFALVGIAAIAIGAYRRKTA